MDATAFHADGNHLVVEDRCRVKIATPKARPLLSWSSTDTGGASENRRRIPEKRVTLQKVPGPPWSYTTNVYLDPTRVM
jgi:hypothetical protein